MTWADVVARGFGGFEFALVIEGCPYMPTTGNSSFSTLSDDLGANFPTQLYDTLDRNSVSWLYKTDLRHGTPQMGSSTFVLKDRMRGTSQHFLSSLMLGSARANTSNLRATCTAGAVQIEVDSTAGWAVPPPDGYFWLDQEACRYTGLLAGPPRFQCVRGVFYSRAISHTYAAPDRDNLDADFGIEPILYSVFPSWIGRRVRLYVAEHLPDGTLSSPTSVWRGKVKTAPDPVDDTTAWSVTCEHLWDAQDVKIPTVLNRGATTLRGFDIVKPKIRWISTVIGGVWAAPTDIEFTLSGTAFESVEDLVNLISVELNASLATNGITDSYLIRVGEGGHVEWLQVAPAGAGTGELRVRYYDDVIKAVLGHNFEIVFPTSGAADPVQGPVTSAVSIVTIHTGELTTVDVASVAGFPTPFDEEGDRYHLRSTVRIEDTVLQLWGVNDPPPSIDVQALIDQPAVGEAQVPSSTLTFAAGANDQISIVPGVRVEGNFVRAWKAFIESTNVPEEWRVGLATQDWDWDEMETFNLGGAGFDVCHDLFDAESFRKLFLSDMRMAGMLPAIGSFGRLSIRPLAVPAYSISLGNVDDYVTHLKSLPKLTPTKDRVVTAVDFEMERRSHFGEPLEPWKLPVPHVGLMRRHEVQNTVTIKSKKSGGLSGWGIFENYASHVVSLASKYFVIFGGEAQVGPVPCGLRAARLLPGDVVQLSHKVVLDPLTGTRGIVNGLALITSVRVQPFISAVVLEVYMPADGARRAGWAPAARVTDYVDNGGGAGDARHELVLAVGNYSDNLTAGILPCSHSPAAMTEGHYFLDGHRITLRQWDDDTAPLSDDLVVSPAEHNAAGTSVYVTAAPANDPGVIGGTWIIHFNAYTTAGQIPSAQAYVHACDETTGEIGASGHKGFKPV